MDRQIFVIALVAICTLAWIITTAIRAKHGYPLTDDWGNTVDRGLPDADRKFDLLGNENERLKGQVLRLEERIAVLERIATDDGARLGREIDALR